MSKTIEEILSLHGKQLRVIKKMFEPGKIFIPDHIFKVAMEEYSKQQSIAFGDWLRSQRPDIFYGSPTSEQLYSYFLKDQSSLVNTDKK